MDIYDQAIRRLRADCTDVKELAPRINVPISTLKDLINSKTKDPQLSTVRKIAKYYFPKIA